MYTCVIKITLERYIHQRKNKQLQAEELSRHFSKEAALMVDRCMRGFTTPHHQGDANPNQVR